MIDSGKGFERNPVMAWLFKILPKQFWWLPKLVIIPAILGRTADRIDPARVRGSLIGSAS
jgi:hypothetical protein